MSQRNLDHSITAFELNLADAMHEIQHAQIDRTVDHALKSLQGAREAVTRSLQTLMAVEAAVKAKFNG